MVDKENDAKWWFAVHDPQGITEPFRAEIKRLEDLILSIRSYLDSSRMTYRTDGQNLLIAESDAIRERRKNG